MSDPLRTLLDELAPDVARTRLADPSAVRRRGDRPPERRPPPVLPPRGSGLPLPVPS